MRTGITQTLLRDWLYCFSCAEGYEQEAEDKFLLSLKREKGEQTEAMKNGILFENGIYALMKNPHDLTVYPQWKEVSRRIADQLRGGQVQVYVERAITVDSEDYLLYGFCDVVKQGQIYDIKWTSSSFHSDDLAGRYLESPQHPAYMYCLPEAYRFTYLVSDGKELYTESYSRSQTPPIADVISLFRQDVKRRGLDELYREKWVRS